MLKKDYQQSRLKTSFRKIYDRYSDLVSKSDLQLSHILTFFILVWSLLITALATDFPDYSKDVTYQQIIPTLCHLIIALILVEARVCFVLFCISTMDFWLTLFVIASFHSLYPFKVDQKTTHLKCIFMYFFCCCNLIKIRYLISYWCQNLNEKYPRGAQLIM